MLTLTRHIGEKIVIGDAGKIRVTVLSIKGKQIRLGIEAPSDTPVDREEIWQLKQQERSKQMQKATVAV
jgi:carbon storage regulator